MTKLFKFKLFIICLVILAVITSAAAFSVSYAKWTGEENNQVSAGVTTGNWKNSSEYDYGIYDTATGEDNELRKKDGSNENNIYYEMYLLFTKNTTFSLSLNGKVIGASYFKDSSKLPFKVDDSGKVTLYNVDVTNGRNGTKIFFVYFSSDIYEEAVGVEDITWQTQKDEKNNYWYNNGSINSNITEYLTKIS